MGTRRNGKFQNNHSRERDALDEKRQEFVELDKSKHPKQKLPGKLEKDTWLVPLTAGDTNDQPGSEGTVGGEHCQLHPPPPEGRQKGVVQPRGGKSRDAWSNHARTFNECCT